MNTLIAAMQDAEKYYEIIQAGRRFQEEQGFSQWTEDYPNLDTIHDDIQKKKGYALMADGKIAGYLCLDFEGEPAYETIEGAWRQDAPYAVAHRMTFHPAFRGAGLADTAFRLIEAVCRQKDTFYIRADTDFPNQRMQHILLKNGYVNCGTVIFQGSAKLAYDKIL